MFVIDKEMAKITRNMHWSANTIWIYHEQIYEVHFTFWNGAIITEDVY